MGLESAVAQISISSGTACAVTGQRAAQCWGGGLNGHLGNGSTADSLAVSDVTDLASGVALIRVGSTQLSVGPRDFVEATAGTARLFVDCTIRSLEAFWTPAGESKARVLEEFDE